MRSFSFLSVGHKSAHEILQPCEHRRVFFGNLPRTAECIQCCECAVYSAEADTQKHTHFIAENAENHTILTFHTHAHTHTNK